MPNGSDNLPRWVVVLVTGLAVFGCRPPVKPAAMFAPVPEAPRRMDYSFADEASNDPQAAQVEDIALEDAICLLRTEKPQECQTEDSDPPYCTVRDPEEIRAALEPTFAALEDLQLRSPNSISNDIRTVLPNVVSTLDVYDARRSAECRMWRAADGACVALRVDKLWILLHAQPRESHVDSFSVYLAERACDENP